VKRFIVVSLLSLALASGAFAAQNKNAKAPAKPSTSNTNAKAPAKPAAAKPAAAPVDDATITAAVKAKLSKTPSLKTASLNAASKDGVVTLTGSVKTGGLKGVATNVAKSVKGVKKVDNQITVEAKTMAPAANKNTKAVKAPTKNKNMK
jgi:hyperosmotically inducible protein